MPPLPEDAKLSTFGCFFAIAISSRVFFAGSEGWTASRIVALAISVTGAKSRTGS